MTAILISGTIFLPALLGVCLSMADSKKKTDTDYRALTEEDLQNQNEQ